MNRRNFVKLGGLMAVGAGWAPWRSWADSTSARRVDWQRLLEPVDLVGRIRLAQGALVGILDPSRRHLPYWSCDVAGGDLSTFKHGPYDGEGVWDRMHNAGRVLHGLTLAEAVTGDRTDPVIIADLAFYVKGLFSEGDGLPGDSATATGKRVASLHNLREVLHGLTALIRRGDDEARTLAGKMVRTLRGLLDESGRLQVARLPGYVSAYTSQPHMEGRTVDALVRYHRVTHDTVALETAGLLTTFALAHCFDETGALTAAAGTHGHSITALIAGMADYAIEVRDPALLSRVRRVFDVGVPRFNSSFGWSMESLHRPVLRGEANNTGDLIRAALLLGQGAEAAYYGRAERMLRSHLLPSQFLDVAGLSDRSDVAEDCRRNLASRARGGFAVPSPNDLQFEPTSALCICDITSGAVDALCMAYAAALVESKDAVTVNLLFDREGPSARIRSALPRDGSLEVDVRPGRALRVRLPEWVDRRQLALRIGGAPAEGRFDGTDLAVAPQNAAATVSLRFPLRLERTVETIVHQPFTIDWRGDQIVAMSPPATPTPGQAPLPPRSFPMFPLCE